VTIRAQTVDDPVAVSQRRDALRRFRRIVRQDVRKFVESQREAPPLTLWASDGVNPRRVVALHVGAAESRADVYSQIVGGIRDNGSLFAAIGRLLYMGEAPDGEHVPTAVFGLVIVSGLALEMWEADAVAGRLGSWRESVFSNEEGERAAADQWFFMQQAVRTNARRLRDAA
jgi:hypothetical protein